MEAPMQPRVSRGLAASVAGVAKAIVRGMEFLSPEPQFSCGDCERNASCGLPPDDLCVIKAMQLARDGEWRRRRPLIGY
jgi:hypothetical protein